MTRTKENGLHYKDKEDEEEYSRLGSFHQIHRISESVETKEQFHGFPESCLVCNRCVLIKVQLVDCKDRRCCICSEDWSNIVRSKLKNIIDDVGWICVVERCALHESGEALHMNIGHGCGFKKKGLIHFPYQEDCRGVVT